ncbi:MAG: hypothetical protein AAFU77_17030 [Myxococcota bacterium]
MRATGPRLAFVTCGYDTAFTSLERQVYRRLAQLHSTYHDLDWQLLIVDDMPFHYGLTLAAHRAADRLGLREKLRILDYEGARFEDGREKGAALMQGMRELQRTGDVDALVYLNLNLKVHAALSATGVRRVVCEGHGAAIGTRSPEEDGWTRGAGTLGRSKSRVFNALVAGMLPEIGRYRDTNAPLKVFGPRAIEVLCEGSRSSHITMDCEWLLLLHREGLDPVRFPIVWTQAPGSHPPWHRVPASALDVFRLRFGVRD